MTISYAFCNVSVLPVRSEPSHRAEQVTQLLFGEKAEILETNAKEWVRIRNSWDGYIGWCRLSQLTSIHRKDFLKPARALAADSKGYLLFEQGQLWLPAGAELMKLKFTLHQEAGKFKGRKLKPEDGVADGTRLREAALQFLHAPYQWGGKSIAGIDCSGLTQLAYRLSNIRLPRDASQQAAEGTTVDFLQHAACGDLAFFDDHEGRIVHVGMLLDEHNIIHATETSGRVVIDRIDPGGIISVSLRKRTHNLRMVKRYL